MSVDLLFTNHLNESITALGATIPSFTTTMTADATVEITASAASAFRETFYFQTDSDIATDGTDDVKYYVDTSKWPASATDLNAATGTIGTANGAFKDGENISESFLRHTANTLFGTHLGVDLFNNETTVKNDLDSQMLNLSTTINTAISDVAIGGSDADLQTGGYNSGSYLDDNVTDTKNISRELVNQLLNNSASRERFNATNLSTYAHPAGVAGLYSVPLITGDSISFKVTVNPAADQDTLVPVGPSTTARSFRVKLILA
jgi:hypothetical protein